MASKHLAEDFHLHSDAHQWAGKKGLDRGLASVIGPVCEPGPFPCNRVGKLFSVKGQRVF